MNEEIKEYTLKFHNIYERLAPNYGYETRKDTKEFDFNSNNGKLMYATVSEIISPLLQKVEQLEKDKSYANWYAVKKEKEVEQLENIRKEAIDYIEENLQSYSLPGVIKDMRYVDFNKLLNILNKGE